MPKSAVKFWQDVTLLRADTHHDFINICIYYTYIYYTYIYIYVYMYIYMYIYI